MSVLRGRADTQQAMGDIQGAIAGYANAEAIGEQVVVARPTDTILLSDLSDTLAAHARAAALVRDQPRAEAASREAMELARRAGELDPGNPHFRDTLASAYSALGHAAAMDGQRLDEVAAWYRESVVTRETLVRDAPDNTEYRRNLMISYGNLGDVLGFRIGENLGDRAGAEDAFAHAETMAEWARQKDARDRRAESDLVNAKLRRGSVIADDVTRTEEGLRVLGDADALVKDLRAAQPNQYVYAILEALIQRRVAAGLTAVGRADEAARRLESARATLTGVMDTPARSNARSLYVTVTVRLAALRADSRSREAATLAEQASVQLTKGSMGSTFLDATTFEDLGRVYLEIARRSSPVERRARLQEASQALEKSESLWRGLKAASAVEVTRVKALHDVETLLADCRALQ
jgi:tetratricopeptide (TPR) repeat protein